MRYLLTFILFVINMSYTFAKVDTIAINKLYAEAQNNAYNHPYKALEQADYLIKNSKKQDIEIAAYFIKIKAYSTLRHHEELLDQLKKTFHKVETLNDSSLKIELINKIAGAYQGLKLYDLSIHNLNETLKIIEKEKDPDIRLKNLCYNQVVRGLIYKDLSRCDIAKEYFLQAAKGYAKIKDLYVANANRSVIYYNLGYCYLGETKLDEAKEVFKQSLAYAELSGTNLLKAYSLKGLASYHFEEKKYEQSITYLKEAVVLSKDIDDLTLQRSIETLFYYNYIATNDWKAYESSYANATKLSRTVLIDENESIYASIKANEEELAERKDHLTLKTLFITGILTAIFIVLSLLFFKNNKKLTLKGKELHAQFIKSLQ